MCRGLESYKSTKAPALPNTTQLHTLGTKYTDMPSMTYPAAKGVEEGLPGRGTTNDSKSDQVHDHPPICRDNFEPGALNPSSNSMKSLCDALIDNLDRLDKDPTSRQSKAIERFKYQGHTNFAQPTNLEDLRRFFEIFNDIFFNGVLLGYCTVGIYSDSHRDREEAYCSNTFRGTWSNGRDPRYLKERDEFQLMFKIRPASKTPWREFLYVLGILLHEMAHAFLSLYGCQCGHGCFEDWTIEDEFFGHGPFWQRITRAMEGTRRGPRDKMFNELPLDLGRQHSMAKAVADGAVLPVEPLLTKVMHDWGFDPKEFFEDIEEMRKENKDTARKTKVLERINLKNICHAGRWIVGSKSHC